MVPSLPLAFDYELPSDRIAQRPVVPYDHAKLLHISRERREFTDCVFRDFSAYLEEGDLLVFNNTKVIPARLRGVLAESGGSIELLLVEELGDGSWFCLGRPLRKLTAGKNLIFRSSTGGDCKLSATVQQRSEKGVVVRFEGGAIPRDVLSRIGQMPIPPYIRGGVSDARDWQDYQTHFAREEGSIAAPTASLHFTPELMQKIDQAGIETAYATLHVGMASFLPLWNEGKKLDSPGEEKYFFDEGLIEQIESKRLQGKRVIAVGTTVVRALESMFAAMEAGKSQNGQWYSTSLFITPGYKFRSIDGLVTNYHQPRTTHLLLVGALLGEELLKSAYEHALASGYRFLSYGDGMLIL